MAEHYEIRVKGHIGAGWVVYFEALHLTHLEDGTTNLTGPVPD